jgi:plastocyanin
MSIRTSLAISALVLTAACGGGDDGNGGTPDAPRPDAQPSKVMAVTCPATTPVTFTTRDLSFNPSTATITVGQTVKFESTQLDHPIGPLSSDPLSDPGLRVPAGQTKCFTFLATGTFKFICSTHNYLGTLTVN